MEAQTKIITAADDEAARHAAAVGEAALAYPDPRIEPPLPGTMPPPPGIVPPPDIPDDLIVPPPSDPDDEPLPPPIPDAAPASDAAPAQVVTPPGLLRATVAGHRRWTDRLHSIYLRAPDFAGFEAGQFGRIGLTIADKPLLRPYSFVNAPADDLLEFYYITIDGGPLTSRLPHLARGDAIWLNPKPNGFLVLSEVPAAKQLWMLATGTALGPFLSILKTDAAWQRFDDMVLVHAARTVAELTYQDDIARLVARGGGRLRYIPFVSRECADFALPGRIPAALQDGALAARAQLAFSPAESQFMLCGNPAMVKQTSATLTELGFARNRRRAPGHITVENYW